MALTPEQVLNKHFQDILHVSKTQSGFIQTSVFGAYFLMALPSALLIRRIGYQRGILHKLGEIERLGAEHAEFVRVLRDLARQFQFDAMKEILRKNDHVA